jgi:FtsP/CotA-like multicopper oxidase with cupredoxin domain
MKRALAGTGALIRPGAALLLSGCRNEPRASQPSQGPPRNYVRRQATETGPTREIRLVVAPGEVEIEPGGPYRTWLYNGQFPGPEIRVTEGERLRVTVENRLPEGTTVHWHGLPVPNAMDGVPGVTQDPIAPGATFLYDFVADVPGTYLYHSHLGLQIDRGLIGPLIIDERNSKTAYDREYTVVLDDFLPGEPRPIPSGMGGMSAGPGMGRGMRGGMMGGMMGAWVPPYTGLLINGRPADAPAVFEVKRGERVRLRLLNPSGATSYRVAIAGHRMAVISTDGQPVQPLLVDALDISMGERYDVIVEANNPGVWTMMAVALEANLPPARAQFTYADSTQGRPAQGEVPEGLRRGRVLDLFDLQAVDGGDTVAPDRTIDLTLSGGMMSSAWTINGQAYPNSDALEIHEGERIRVRMTNVSPMLHPMHLHGHFFRTGQVLKDTVIVPPHMGRTTFDFTADNPGKWFFHCHNIYHMESGMARVFRYV